MALLPNPISLNQISDFSIKILVIVEDAHENHLLCFFDLFQFPLENEVFGLDLPSLNIHSVELVITCKNASDAFDFFGQNVIVILDLPLNSALELSNMRI